MDIGLIWGIGFLDEMHALEQKNQRNAAQRQQAEQKEIIHERPQMRLLIQQRINGGVSLPRRGHGISVVREQMFGGGQTLRERRVGRREMRRP